MLYQLPSGKVIEISLDHYLSMTDEELNEFTRLSLGNTVENPFAGSALDGKYMAYEDIEEDLDTEPDLTDIDIDMKLMDEDFQRDDI